MYILTLIFNLVVSNFVFGIDHVTDHMIELKYLHIDPAKELLSSKEMERRARGNKRRPLEVHQSS